MAVAENAEPLRNAMLEIKAKRVFLVRSFQDYTGRIAEPSYADDFN